MAGPGRRRRRLWAGLVLACTLAAVACGGTERAGTAPDEPAGSGPGTPHTTPPVPATVGAARPGDVVSLTEVELPPGLEGRAWHVAHALPGVGGEPTVATALVVAPPLRDAGTSPRPVLAWAHPTRGGADACAPAQEGPASIPDLERWLAAGVTVVASDYEGLGGPGPHPYLVGASEGRSVLWATVAARRVPGAGIDADAPVVLWGFSQGGHAAAFAGQMASQEVPDLDLRGVAVVAPVSDVAAFARRAEARGDQVGVLVAIVAGQLAADPSLDATAVLTDEAVTRLGLVERACIGEVVEAFTGPPQLTSRRRVAEDPGWSSALADDLTGTAPVPAPVLVVQGSSDDTVDPADTAALVARWCAAGTSVRHVVIDGGGHGTTTTDVVEPWVLDRLADRSVGTTCDGPPVVVAADR